jgi:hypothetical protein
MMLLLTNVESDPDETAAADLPILLLAQTILICMNEECVISNDSTTNQCH